MKKIVITQSNYIPWRGYFDLISCCDEFIFYDEVQYTRRDWRNRNQILLNDKAYWLTIPLINKGNYNEIISNMRTSDDEWIVEHLKKIKSYYLHVDNFKEKYDLIEHLYKNIKGGEYLSDINKQLIIQICKHLKVEAIFIDSNSIKKQNQDDSSERLLNICLARNANTYITGSNAKSYLRTEIFKKNNIEILWFDYGSSKQYPQKSKSFIPNLSIIDCIMNCGVDKNKFMNY